MTKPADAETLLSRAEDVIRGALIVVPQAEVRDAALVALDSIAAERDKLAEIDKELVHDHNALVIDGSRQRTRAEKAEAERDANLAEILRLQELWLVQSKVIHDLQDDFKRQLRLGTEEVRKERDEARQELAETLGAGELLSRFTRLEKAEATVARQEEALREARKRLRVNAVAWHTKFHSRSLDFEDCDVTSCTNDQDVLASIDAALAGSDVPPADTDTGEAIECGDRYVLHVADEEDPRIYYCSLAEGHDGAHLERDLIWPGQETPGA